MGSLPCNVTESGGLRRATVRVEEGHKNLMATPPAMYERHREFGYCPFAHTRCRCLVPKPSDTVLRGNFVL